MSGRVTVVGLLRAVLTAILLLAVWAGIARADGLFRSFGAQTFGQEPSGAAFLATQRARDLMLDAAYLHDRIAPTGLDRHADRLRRIPPQQGVRIELFPGVALNLQPTSISAAYGGGFVWTGTAPNGWADLVIRDGRITGHVTVTAPYPTNYRIDPVGPDGRHRITELDGSAFPPEGHPPVPGRNDHGHLPGHDYAHDHDQGLLEQWRDGCRRGELRGVRARMATRDSLAACDDGPQGRDLRTSPGNASITTIDVLIAYTQAAAAAVADIEAQANLAVSLSNTAYERSNVHIRLRLVGTHLVTGYAERGYSRMLDDVTDGLLAPFRTVHQLRDSLGADLVALLVASQEWCGIAWLPHSGPGADRLGYSVTTVGCIANHAFVHELGHNMGLLHDRFVESAAPATQYNFGHVSLPGQFLTVMSYFNECRANDLRCTRINSFSNPAISHLGHPTGIPAGTSGAADAARWLNEVRHRIADYRPTRNGSATTTQLSGPSAGVPGESLAFRAIVTSASGIPGGTVRFLRDGTQMAIVTLDMAGQASFVTDQLPEGAHRITAAYSGNTAYLGSTSAPLAVTISPPLPSPPVNDRFADRITIPEAGTVQGTNVGAAAEAGQPPIAVAGSTNAVWWRFTPPVNGTLGIDTCGSDFDTTLAVFTGLAVNALSQVAANDDACGTRSRVEFQATAGTEYQIAVAGFGNATGAIVLALALVPDPVATVTTLSAPATSRQGQPVLLRATVTGPGGAITGTVEFRNGPAVLGRVTMADGVADWTASTLGLGEHSLSAAYEGSATHRASVSSPVLHRVDPAEFSEGNVFIGGGAVFGMTEACRAVFPGGGEAVTVRHSPAELNGPPSGISVVWRSGSEHLSLWGPIPASDLFRGGSGRSTWARFTFYPTRPLVRTVQRDIVDPPGGRDLGTARVLLLRVRVQNFGTVAGCSATIVATLRRTE